MHLYTLVYRYFRKSDQFTDLVSVDRCSLMHASGLYDCRELAVGCWAVTGINAMAVIRLQRMTGKKLKKRTKECGCVTWGYRPVQSIRRSFSTSHVNVLIKVYSPNQGCVHCIIEASVIAKYRNFRWDSKNNIICNRVKKSILASQNCRWFNYF